LGFLVRDAPGRVTPAWERLDTQRAARRLERFCCVDGQAGVDRPWERAAQAALRRAGTSLRPEQSVLVAVEDCVDVAAALFELVTHGDQLRMFVFSVAVASERRGRGGIVADQLMAELRRLACDEARQRGCRSIVFVGKIHVRNLASERAAKRTGLEPGTEIVGDYRFWGRRLDVDDVDL